MGTVVSIIGYYLYHKWDDAEYPWVTNDDQSLVGKIQNTRPYQSIVRVKLMDGSKYKIAPARNYAHYPYSLNEFISTYDSIFKLPDSDTVQIKRGEKTFIFLLRQDLNKSLRSDL